MERETTYVRLRRLGKELARDVYSTLTYEQLKQIADSRFREGLSISPELSAALRRKLNP